MFTWRYLETPELACPRSYAARTYVRQGRIPRRTQVLKAPAPSWPHQTGALRASLGSAEGQRLRCIFGRGVFFATRGRILVVSKDVYEKANPSKAGAQSHGPSLGRWPGCRKGGPTCTG